MTDTRSALEKETHTVVVQGPYGIEVYAEKGWCPLFNRPCTHDCEDFCLDPEPIQ